jgi:hypothetical protein
MTTLDSGRAKQIWRTIAANVDLATPRKLKPAGILQTPPARRFLVFLNSGEL